MGYLEVFKNLKDFPIFFCYDFQFSLIMIGEYILYNFNLFKFIDICFMI